MDSQRGPSTSPSRVRLPIDRGLPPRGITLRLEGDVNDYLGRDFPAGDSSFVRIARPRLPLSSTHHRRKRLPTVPPPVRSSSGPRSANAAAFATPVPRLLLKVPVTTLCEYMTGGGSLFSAKRAATLPPGCREASRTCSIWTSEVVNRDMVDVEALGEGDLEFLFEVVSKHAAETGSVVAEALIADWSHQVDRFRKIMPRDYKRVLEAIARAESLGENVDEAVMEAAWLIQEVS